MNVQAAITHILPLTTIRRERLLPVPGRVVARRGQHITPSDVVAEAIIEPEHILLDIGRGLGMPAKETDQYLACKGGDQVAVGDVLAGPVGVARRVVRAPYDGVVVVAGDGQLLLQIDTPPFELKAAYQGVIADLVGDRGVIIDTTGALIQGVWGNGRSSYGLLNVLAHAPDETLSAGQLEVSLRGSVVVAGYCDNEAALQAAADLPLRGLILASMAARLAPFASKLEFPLILIEGFGKIPMNSAAFKLLSTSERRDVTINAERWDRYAGTRPELILSVPPSAQSELPDETDVITTGKRVRVISPPFRSKIATVVTVPSSLSILPSGVSTAAANVRFEDGETALVPLANLDLIG
jgi:hypothetical protein